MAHHFQPFHHLHATEMDLHFGFIDILCEDHSRANAFQKDFIAIFPHYKVVKYSSWTQYLILMIKVSGHW